MRKQLVLLLLFAACARTEPAEAPFFIHDDDGRALVLHGLNVSNSAKGNEDRHPTLTEEEVRRMGTEWGFNLARYLILWDAVEPEPGVYDEVYLDGVRERLDWFESAGMHVVLDMHQDVYSAQFCCDGAPAWAVEDDGLAFELQNLWFLNYFQPAVQAAFDNFWEVEGDHPELQEHYEAMWQHVATRLGDHPAVLGYDIMNEPHPGSRFDAVEALTRDPMDDRSEDFDREYLGPFYQRMVNGLREVDADSYIFFEGRYGAVANGSPSFLPHVDDPRDGASRLVYFPHLYSVSFEANEVYAEDDDTLALWEQEREREVQTLQTPLLVGEWGLNQSFGGSERFVTEFLAMADQSTSGWAYWSADPGSWGPLLSDGSENLPLLDHLVRAYPKAVPGRLTSMVVAEDHALTVVFDRDRKVDAPLVIAVPTRHFPDGFTVQVQTEGDWEERFDAEAQELQIDLPPRGGATTVTVSPAAR